MTELKIVINCGEDFRITYKDDKKKAIYHVSTHFLGDDPDWSYFAQVDRETFKKCLEYVSWIPTGWSQELKDQYQAVLDFLEETEE